MTEYKINFWDERYSSDEYVYGTEPNKFLKEQIQKIKPVGNLLLPGEGEGRNAVFAAMLGWVVYAFDQSSVAKIKAQNQFDLIILDIQMPKRDGYEVSIEIRKLEDGQSHIPILALTANAQTDDRQRGKE